ncbi:MAG: GAF domain-containing protein, partial [Cyanobacteriota bacterium]|nr:GAF domain-containing protein [Cyanobacteriota bacterium]
MTIHSSSHIRLKGNLPRSFAGGIMHPDDDSLRVPGYIQSHGILLVLREPELEILQVSDNTFKVLGIHPERLIHSPLSQLLGEAPVEKLKANLARHGEDLDIINPIPLCIQTADNCWNCDGIVHRNDRVLILEIEPKQSEPKTQFLEFYHLVRGAIAKFGKLSTFSEICEAAAREYRKITGCDRAMIYKFDRDGNGTVIAEDKCDELPPFLGLNYPALDIPESSRNLFLKNRIRTIADINEQPAQILPSSHPLDLSFSGLRGVAPCHIEYLRNMGVRASLGISLLKNKRLWGLVVCHYTTPKILSYEVRAACELLGQTMSIELSTREENRDYEYRLELKSIQAKFIEVMSRADSLMEGLVQQEQNLLNLVSAKGTALCLGSEIALLGDTPSVTEIRQILRWLNNKPFHNNIF